jgi:hypothetical protein
MAADERHNECLLPSELIRSVEVEAAADADRVATFLREAERAGSPQKSSPRRYPAAFLLGAGAALRLAH